MSGDTPEPTGTPPAPPDTNTSAWPTFGWPHDLHSDPLDVNLSLITESGAEGAAAPAPGPTPVVEYRPASVNSCRVMETLCDANHMADFDSFGIAPPAGVEAEESSVAAERHKKMDAMLNDIDFVVNSLLLAMFANEPRCYQLLRQFQRDTPGTRKDLNYELERTMESLNDYKSQTAIGGPGPRLPTISSGTRGAFPTSSLLALLPPRVSIELAPQGMHKLCGPGTRTIHMPAICSDLRHFINATTRLEAHPLCRAPIVRSCTASMLCDMGIFRLIRMYLLPSSSVEYDPASHAASDKNEKGHPHVSEIAHSSELCAAAIVAPVIDFSFDHELDIQRFRAMHDNDTEIWSVQDTTTDSLDMDPNDSAWGFEYHPAVQEETRLQETPEARRDMLAGLLRTAIGRDDAILALQLWTIGARFTTKQQQEVAFENAILTQSPRMVEVVLDMIGPNVQIEGSVAMHHMLGLKNHYMASALCHLPHVYFENTADAWLASQALIVGFVDVAQHLVSLGANPLCTSAGLSSTMTTYELLAPLSRLNLDAWNTFPKLVLFATLRPLLLAMEHRPETASSIDDCPATYRSLRRSKLFDINVVRMIGHYARMDYVSMAGATSHDTVPATTIINW
jgi:hypothetical protein